MLCRVEILTATVWPAQELKISISSWAVRRPRGSDWTIPQCSLEPFGREAGLGTSSSGRRPWEVAGEPSSERSSVSSMGKGKETWKSVNLEEGVL